MPSLFLLAQLLHNGTQRIVGLVFKEDSSMLNLTLDSDVCLAFVPWNSSSEGSILKLSDEGYKEEKFIF